MNKALFYFLVLFVGIITTCAAECNSTDTPCFLPNCLCPDLAPPYNLDPTNIPQIVMLTFDDAINTVNFPIYEELFFNRTNPNGYPITLTFFVTHEYNNYKFTHDLYVRGNDIALHSITHKSEISYWAGLTKDDWEAEIMGQRQMTAYLANIPPLDIVGLRAPFLQIGGDAMMSAIKDDLEWDCSRPTWSYQDPALWPHTYDYEVTFQDCQIQPCPQKSYKGFWNVPMVDWTGDNGSPCAMLDTCQPDPNTTDKVYDLFLKNFNRHYNGNRAPFGIFTHAAWLSELLPGHKDGYVKFLNYLQGLDDVYIVSVSKALAWIKEPVTLDEIKNFAPWQTVFKDNKCTPFNCNYKPEQTPGFPSERYMVSCKPCPPRYPWLGNPIGTPPPTPATAKSIS